MAAAAVLVLIAAASTLVRVSAKLLQCEPLCEGVVEDEFDRESPDVPPYGEWVGGVSGYVVYAELASI